MFKNTKRVFNVIANEIALIKNEKTKLKEEVLEKDGLIKKLNSEVGFFKERVKYYSERTEKFHVYENVINYLKINSNIINKHDFYMFIIKNYGFYYDKNNRTWICPSGDMSYPDFHDISYKECKKFGVHDIFVVAKNVYKECFEK